MGGIYPDNPLQTKGDKKGGEKPRLLNCQRDFSAGAQPASSKREGAPLSNYMCDAEGELNIISCWIR